jgi:hypothetical protein
MTIRHICPRGEVIMNIQKKQLEQSRSLKLNSSEADEYQHERNPVASAQKQAASQETTGLLEEQ